MPLPTGNPEWPPPETRKPNGLYDKWGAWYSGDPAELARVYGDLIGTGPAVYDPQASAAVWAGGIRGFLARMWWGRPAQPGSLQEAKLHVPLAGDIASTSADLLFGEPPTMIVPDAKDGDATQARLDVLMTEAHATLIEAAETIAAFGGGYLRVGWDEEVADHPLFYAYPPDSAVPEWRSGHLWAVTFFREVGRDGGKVWRHLERHEQGRILHGLYAGTDDRLGRPMALGDHPDTEAYMGVVDADGGEDTGYDGLCAQYVPNMRPNRVLRGSPLGRSDFAGIEPIMDALDEAWTSWMRDLRLGKARIMVPDQYIRSEGRGQGAYFDPEQAIFQAVNALPDAAGRGGLQITPVQFLIRVTEHQATCQALATQALRGAGYNAQTFGETGEVAATATEVVARERRSFTTRSRKIRYWSGPLARIFEAALAVDIKRFRTAGAKVVRPGTEWPDGVSVDPEATARTLQLIFAAESASTRTRVEMLHPDWLDTDIDEEAQKILAEKQAAAPAGGGGAQGNVDWGLFGGNTGGGGAPGAPAAPKPGAPKPGAPKPGAPAAAAQRP